MKYSKDHIEYYNKDNIEVPSVTTILKILNKPLIFKWANILGFKRQKIEDVLETTSYIGTLVHGAIQSYFMKMEFIFIQHRMIGKSTLKLYLDKFFDWKNLHDIKVEFMEKSFVTDKYGGTIDFYGFYDDKRTILDFKTSKKFYSTMFLQLAAYCILLEERDYLVEQVGIIIINDKGYKEKIISRKKLNKYIEVFKSLLDLFHKWFDLNEEEGWESIL
jgi:hypothetical protein